MGATASLHSLSSDTCEAFEDLAESYWPTGEEPEPFSCSFDKEWHMLHFLLTGTAAGTDHPLGILVERGPQMEVVAEECRAISPDEMQEFHNTLGEQALEILRQRFDWGAMTSAGVYGASSSDEFEGAFDYVTQSIPDLQKFASNCVKHKCGALVIIA